MRRFLGILIVLVIAVIGVLLVAPNFIPAEVYRGQIEAAAERSTGRALAINGDIRLAFFPRFQVELNDVTFANRGGASPETMASMDKMSIGLQVMPLFRGDVVVDRFVLERPVIVLDVDRSGHGNWEFDLQTDEPAAASDNASSEGGGYTLNEISLGDVRLVDGDVRFRDARSDTDYHLENIDLTVSLPTLSGPLGLDGAVTYNGERLTLDTEIASPRGFLDGDNTPVTMALRSNVLRFSFNGSAATARGGALPFAAGGNIDLTVPSVRRLAAWQGSPINSPGGFGEAAVNGTLNASGNRISFGDAELSFDEMAGTGDFALTLGGARPNITGNLALNDVDVRPYTGDPNASPQRNRGSASSEWSTDPIDFSALRTVDADLNIVAEQVITPTLQMGRSNLDVTLRNGVLAAVIEEMNLYEGGGTARLEIDARNSDAVIRQQSTISLVQALPLFTDLANFRALEGVGNISLDVTTRGRSQRDLISALNGSGEIRFNDGTLRGINIANLVRTVGSNFTEMQLPTGPQATDFAELGGTFQIRDGVVTNLDMRLLNPLLRVTGAGNTNLVTRTIEYRIVPEAVMTLEGQGSTRDITGTSVPFLISGTWDNLRYGPDVRAVGEQLLQGVLGGGNRNNSGTTQATEGDTPAATEEPEEDLSPGDQMLRNLFGRPSSSSQGGSSSQSGSGSQSGDSSTSGSGSSGSTSSTSGGTTSGGSSTSGSTGGTTADTPEPASTAEEPQATEPEPAAPEEEGTTQEEEPTNERLTPEERRQQREERRRQRQGG